MKDNETTKKKNKFVRGLLFVPKKVGGFFPWLVKKIRIKISTKTMLIYGGVYLVIGLTWAGLTYALIDAPAAAVWAFVGVPVTLGLLCALGFVFSGGLLKPVRKITEATKKNTRETLSTRLDIKQSQDELRELTNVLNSMLENLEQTVTAQDRFVSDAAHELRTPLTILKGYTQVLLRWGSENPEVLRESLQIINNETDSMNSLIERLLILTKSRAYAPQKNDFFINELVEDVQKEFSLADNGLHKLIFGRMEAFNILADKGMIKQLLRILTENALKYTPDGGTVTFSCYREGDKACVVISDDGIGINEEDLPFVFERFYRSDKARVREGGAGLGLSIAKKIIDAHGGEIIIESEHNKGTSATIYCPIGLEEEEE
jgi:signal transduction histidine kinase